MLHREPENFSVGQARSLVSDLFRVDPRIFWADFLVSVTIGYTAATTFLLVDHWTIVFALVVAMFALYRVSLFMHEIVHFREREMRGFKWTWNLLAGVPMLTPSFFYESHQAHHNTHLYGTPDDGEYLPLGNGAFKDVVYFLCQVFIQPILVVTRFLLTPITFLHPKLRQWTLEHASSFVINLRFHRPIPANANRTEWAWMDLLCSLRTWAIFIPAFAGLTPWWHIPKLYIIAISILTLNYVRTLAAHMYLNDGRRMTHEEQLLDSTVITGNWLTELMCPVGLRYHALHHLFPTMPYHNLGEAHRRLMAGLPEGSSYHRVVYPTFLSVIRELVRNIREAPSRRRAATHEEPLATARQSA